MGLSAHKKKHVENEEKIYNLVNLGKFSCADSKCGKIFEDLPDLQAHYSLEHSNTNSNQNMNNMYKCHICRNTSIDLTSLQTHIAMTHEEMEPIPCELCSEVFFERYSELNHMDRFHKELYYQHHQKYSNFFRQSDDLSSSVISTNFVTTNLVNGKFKCEFCVSEYMHKRDLARHMRQKHSQFSVSGENSENKMLGGECPPKKYDCDKCCYSTYRAHHLKDHKKSQAYCMNEKHKCQICENYTSCTNTGLNTHMKIFNHQNSNPTVNSNPNSNFEEVIEGKPILIGHKEQTLLEKYISEGGHQDAEKVSEKHFDVTNSPISLNNVTNERFSIKVEIDEDINVKQVRKHAFKNTGGPQNLKMSRQNKLVK